MLVAFLHYLPIILTVTQVWAKEYVFEYTQTHANSKECKDATTLFVTGVLLLELNPLVAMPCCSDDVVSLNPRLRPMG